MKGKKYYWKEKKGPNKRKKKKWQRMRKYNEKEIESGV